MIEDCGQYVAYLAPCSRCKRKRVQPQFHVYGADILQICCSPLGDDMVCKVKRICLDGCVGFFLFGQLVLAVVGDKFGDRFRHSELRVDVVAKRFYCFFCILLMRKTYRRTVVRFRYVRVPSVSSRICSVERGVSGKSCARILRCIATERRSILSTTGHTAHRIKTRGAR